MKSFHCAVFICGASASLPSRERGLKFHTASASGNSAAVAPLAGAWIEISDLIRENICNVSLPSRERGLKFLYPLHCLLSFLSLPSRERGLKFDCPDRLLIVRFQSLPSRERGLKSPIIPINGLLICRRSPRGSVD